VIRLLCSLAILVGGVLLAQELGGTLLAQELGTLHGFVVMEKGKTPVVDTPVEVENLVTSKTISSHTDQYGRFTIDGLLPSKYRLSVTVDRSPTVSWQFQIAMGDQSDTFSIKPTGAPPYPRERPPVAEIPQVPNGLVSVGNGGSITFTSTAFGLLIALLKDSSVPPAGNTTLTVVFTPFLLKSKGSQNGKLQVVPNPRPDRGLTFDLQSAPPTDSTGNQVWVWALKAGDDFNGSDVMVDVALTLSDAKGTVLDRGSATTAALILERKPIDKPSWIAAYKDILGPVLAAIITGVFGFVVGRTQKSIQEGRRLDGWSVRVPCPNRPPRLGGDMRSQRKAHVPDFAPFHRTD
jgi:hypothetical protein